MGNSQEDYEAAKIGVVAFEQLDERPIQVHAELLLKIFYRLLEVVPISPKVCMINGCLFTLYIVDVIELSL
jgi:hypothetical protein